MATLSTATSFTETVKQYGALLSTYLRPIRAEVAALAVMLFGGIGLQLWTPQFLQEFIDLAQSGGMSDALIRRAVLFLVLSVVGRILQLGTSYVTQDVRWRATNALRGDLAEHCLQLDMSFHNAHTPGSIISRIDGDVNVLSNFFSQLVLQLVGNAVLLSGIIMLLSIEDWRIGTVFLVFVGAVGLALAKSIALTAPLWKELLQVESEQYGFLEEYLGGTEDIRANGAVVYVLRQLKGLMRGLYLALRKALMTSMVLNFGFTEGMFSLGSILALGLGGLLFLRGELTIGTVYLVFHYNTMLKWPLNELMGQIRDLQSAVGSIERVQELFDTPLEVQEPEPSSAQTLPSGPLAVHFSGVDFGYADERLVLKNLSWTLAPGDVLGILGRTGSGKTTITRLLCRLYDPREGDVCVGDVLLPRVPLADLHRRVGVVTQDVQLFEATVRDNLTIFDDAIGDDTILSVVDQLGLGPWLQDLSDGLDTMLSASTAGLSAGEAQLLAFTRVFLRDPGLVILDEASSRLDPLTERLMERAIDRLFQDRTAVIVAHRLATVQRADKIMILEDGCIVEFGERPVLAIDPTSRFSQLLRTGLEEVLA
ncbi:MAG: ABC transporter ATP-binding protein/permease [Anaerolineae bacterium]|nr:ABC transporter ATP-binding protein/permease [Anaerolineae bacterium]